MDAEQYSNLEYGGIICRRWWAHPKILVGGSINDTRDWNHLRDDFRISAVLSVESEHGDGGKVVNAPLCQLPTSDDGQPKPIEWWWAGFGFAAGIFEDLNAILYVHCQMGGSRSPAMAYGILRTVFGKSGDEALEAIRAGVPTYGSAPGHIQYLESCERAISKMWNMVKGICP